MADHTTVLSITIRFITIRLAMILSTVLMEVTTEVTMEAITEVITVASQDSDRIIQDSIPDIILPGMADGAMARDTGTTAAL